MYNGRIKQLLTLISVNLSCALFFSSTCSLPCSPCPLCSHQTRRHQCPLPTTQENVLSFAFQSFQR